MLFLAPKQYHAPVADDETFTAPQGGNAAELDLDEGTSLPDGDADLPYDTLTVDVEPAVASGHGKVTLRADGTLVYEHDGSEKFITPFGLKA